MWRERERGGGGGPFQCVAIWFNHWLNPVRFLDSIASSIFKTLFLINQENKYYFLLKWSYNVEGGVVFLMLTIDW